MSKFSSPVTDHHIGFSCHGGMGGTLGKCGTENGIFTLGTHTADGVTQVKIFQVQLSIVCLEITDDLIFEQKTYIFVQNISGSIFLTLFA